MYVVNKQKISKVHERVHVHTNVRTDSPQFFFQSELRILLRQPIEQ